MNSDSLKMKIRDISDRTGVDPQELWQMFFLERMLLRVSMSKYKDNFILKGGLLIASMIGIDSRSTRDVDTTIKSYPVSERNIEKMLDDIFFIDMEDGITFEIQSIKEIRDEDQYYGYRVVVIAKVDRVKQHVKIDISTGDQITPSEIKYEFKSSFGLENIEVMSYNLETILAEKLESILSRATETTRMRDFYDIYILMKLYEDEIDWYDFGNALRATALHRGTSEAIDEYEVILEVIRDDSGLEGLWSAYQKKYSYAEHIDYYDVILSLEKTCKLVATYT